MLLYKLALAGGVAMTAASLVTTFEDPTGSGSPALRDPIDEAGHSRWLSPATRRVARPCQWHCEEWGTLGREGCHAVTHAYCRPVGISRMDAATRPSRAAAAR